MLKLTQPHLSINNMFPPINAHSRPPSEDLRGVGATPVGTTEAHSASKQQQIRRQQQQQTMDHQRRSPLRSNSLLPSTTSRHVSAAAAAAAVQSPSISVSPLVRSSSFVQTGSSVQFEPAKIIYRSNDYAWNDHPNNTNASNQPVRAGSPIKPKLTTSARHLTNGILHESTVATTGNSMLHIPTSSTPQQARDDMNNGDLLLSSATKSRQTTRLQRTNSHLDKPPGPTNYGLPMRSESYRSSRLDYNMRPRHTSSKQRNYVNSKTSFHEINGGDFYLSGTQDENIHYQQQQPQQQMSLLSSTQRLNGSTFDLTASRKPLSPNKSSTFNIPASGIGQHNYFNSTQELHRSETTIDRNHFTRFAVRGTTSKEQILSTPKYHHTSGVQTTASAAGTSNTPGERHPSAQSYKSRDPNVSYAYTDVKKYIEENDLMSPEKEQIIRNWVIDVDKYRHQLQKID